MNVSEFKWFVRVLLKIIWGFLSTSLFVRDSMFASQKVNV